LTVINKGEKNSERVPQKNILAEKTHFLAKILKKSMLSMSGYEDVFSSIQEFSNSDRNVL